jgi:diketogulonate reductase-like aldo/keto reductase
MARDVPDIALNNGVEMPSIGLGVFQTPPDETRSAVAAALGTGYRHIDTAAAYGNEREVGEAVHASKEGRVAVFLETKIWISDYGYDQTLHAFGKSAGKLGVDQIDLLILHQPLPSALDKTLEAYRALERLLKDGKVRAIGVSNFMVEQQTATASPCWLEGSIASPLSRTNWATGPSPSKRTSLIATASLPPPTAFAKSSAPPMP